MHIRAIFLIGLVALASAALAQENPAVQEPAAPATASPTPDSAGGAMVESILNQELDPPRNGFIYNPAGRRDPFISLARPVPSDAGTRPRRPGIEGFLLQETSLKGVVKTGDGWIAVLEGPDQKGYFVRLGQPMHDGVVTSIDATGLSFRQEITDPLSPAKTREVRRLLNSAQEESNK